MFYGEASREWSGRLPGNALSWRVTGSAAVSSSLRLSLMSLRSRLAKLSHAQLLKFAVDACESSPELKNKADALIAQVAPLPAWCVDILMSPDLLYAAQGSNPSLED